MNKIKFELWPSSIKPFETSDLNLLTPQGGYPNYNTYFTQRGGGGHWEEIIAMGGDL